MITAPANSVLKAIEEDASVGLLLLQGLSSRILQTETMIETLTHRDMSSRLVSFLMVLCRDFGVASEKGITIDLRLSHQAIAEAIGSTRVTITRLLGDLKDSGLLSIERKKIAKLLQDSVISILRDLGLENANFSIQFSECKPSYDGIDNIQFLFSANPDQRLAPLSNVISGGEKSRFLLAIKSSISKKPNTFFLDEIDNGLSGKSLFALVKLIKEISKEQQVLCITHQPFLAAGGYAHFKVYKDVRDGITYTSISKLSTKKERKNELIELIGGGSNEANDYASRLLDRAAA